MDIAALGIAMDTSGMKRGDEALNKAAQSANRAADAMDKTSRSSQRMTEEEKRKAEALKRAERATQDSANALSQYGGTLGRLVSEVAMLSANLSKTTQALIGIGVGAAALNYVETGMYRVLRATAEVQAQIERINIGLKFANSGNAAAASRDLDFLRDTAYRLGLDIDVASRSFVKLASSARETALEGQKTREIFTAIAEASAVMGLSSAESEGALLAISQMMSKGTVQAEELRGQLGERIPGAFQIAARAMGVTTSELGKMLEQGEVIADEFLPRFARQLRDELSGSIEEASKNTSVALGQLDSAFTTMKRSFTEAGWGEFAAGQMRILADAANGVAAAIRTAKAEGAGMAGQTFAGLGAGLKFLNPVNGFSYSPQSDAGRIGALQAEAEKLQKSLDAAMEKNKYYVTGTGYTVAQASKHVASLNAEIMKIKQSGMSPGGQASVRELDNEIARETARAGKAAQDATSKFITSGKSKTAQERTADDIRQIDEEFKVATKALDKGSELYAKALGVAEARKAEVLKKASARGKKGGAGAASAQYQNELGGELAELEAYARERKSIERGILIDLDTERAQRLMTEREYIRRVYEEKENALIDEQAIAQQQADIAGGRKQLAERERYMGKVAELEQQIVNNKKEMTNALVKEDMRARDSLNAYVAALENSLAVRRSEVSSELSVMGRGDRAREELGRIIAANREADQKFYDLSRSLSEGRVSKDEYDQQLAALREYQSARIQLEYETTAKLKAAQGDWSLGARRALENFHDSAENIFGATDEFVRHTLQSMEDRLVNLARTGKFSFRDMADSIVDDLLRIQIRSMMSGLLGGQGTGGGNMLMGLLGQGVSLLAGGASSGFGFGAAASVATGSMGTIPFSDQSMMLASQIFHEGGIVGGPARGRSVPMSTFSGARRYHSGGIASDEVPAILQKGEEVLTRKDPRHAQNGGGARTTLMNNTFVLSPEGATKATQNQIAQRAYRAVRLAERRNG